MVGSISAGMHIVVLAQKDALVQSVLELFEQKEVQVSFIPVDNGMLTDEYIKTTLKNLADSKADIDGFLCFVGSSALSETVPFFFAKHLSRYFHRSAHSSRKTFMVAMQLDGAFGMTGSSNWQPSTASLTGLVKTLHQEWPWVFTRIVDLSPELDSTSIPSLVLSEWSDIDTRLVEVGHQPDSRQTVEFDLIPSTEGEQQ